MPLFYDYGDTPAWQAVGDDEEAQQKLFEVTQGLIFQTIGNGMPDITEQNEAEWYARQLVWNRVHGYTPWTATDVHGHVGLSTNAQTLTRAQFIKRLFPEQLDRAVARYEEALKEMVP